MDPSGLPVSAASEPLRVADKDRVSAGPLRRGTGRNEPERVFDWSVRGAVFTQTPAINTRRTQTDAPMLSECVFHARR